MCSQATQLTDLKGVLIYSYFHFFNRGHFPNGRLAAQLFAKHIQMAESIAWGMHVPSSLEEVAG